MTSKNGNTASLSAIDFLGLAEQRQTRAVDLTEVGRSGVVWIRELSVAEKAAVMGRMKGKARVHRDRSTEIDLSQMPDDAAPRLLRYAMVTDESGKAQMYDAWLAELGKPHLVMERLENLPNAVVNLIAREVRRLSGMDDEERDEVDEKKES